MSEHFDVCVLGGQPAGLLTAALCAKRGLRTAVVDHGEGFDHYKHNSIAYPLMPQPQIGMKSSKVVEQVLTELGAQVDFPRRYSESNYAFQAIYPRHRVNVSATPELRHKELARAFGADAGAFAVVERAMKVLSDKLEVVLDAERELPARGLIAGYLQRKRLEKLADLMTPASYGTLFPNISRDHPAREMVLEAAQFFGHFDDEDPPASTVAFVATHLLSGTVRIDGPRGSYFEALAGLVTGAGGVVKTGAIIKDITSEGGNVRGIESANRAVSLTASVFVDALFSPDLWQQLPMGRGREKYLTEESSLKPKGRLYVHHFLVEAKGLPVGLADNVLLLNGRQAAREEGTADSAVWVTVRREPGKPQAVLSAAIPVPEQDASFLPESLAQQRLRVRRQLERLMPFLSPYIKAESSPMTPSDWDKVESGGRRIDSWAVHPLYGDLPGRLVGVSGLPVATPLKNVLRVGRRVLPGLGPLADYFTARNVADMIGKRLKKDKR